jgi:L-fucose mutarotase/ribose pyranase (RbsD/FucU family)
MCKKKVSGSIAPKKKIKKKIRTTASFALYQNAKNTFIINQVEPQDNACITLNKL